VSRHFSVDFQHRVVFTRGLLDVSNPVLGEALKGGSRRLIAFVDSGFAAAHPKFEADLRARLTAEGDGVDLLDLQVVAGGEACKFDRRVVDLVVEKVNQHHLCRRSWVLAAGGGAVLDAVGYGAAISHRGVRLVRVPTTVLAQDDAGLGVKNGINRFGKKNFEGVFAVPWAVLNDTDHLATLPERHWRGGFSEAVKISLLKDRGFFDQIERDAVRIRHREMAAALPVIRRCAELHLDHIVSGGDPFELEEARPLDYGHWAAHKLEQLSGHELSHGEAVAIGVALDTEYSAQVGWLDRAEADSVIQCLRSLGLPTWHRLLHDPLLAAGIEEFREHLGGHLCVTLIRGIGMPSNTDFIDHSMLLASIDRLESTCVKQVS